MIGRVAVYKHLHFGFMNFAVVIVEVYSVRSKQTYHACYTRYEIFGKTKHKRKSINLFYND